MWSFIKDFIFSLQHPCFYRFLVLQLTEFVNIFAPGRHFYPDFILNTKYFVSNFVIQNPCSHMSLLMEQKQNNYRNKTELENLSPLKVGKREKPDFPNIKGGNLPLALLTFTFTQKRLYKCYANMVRTKLCLRFATFSPQREK